MENLPDDINLIIYYYCGNNYIINKNIYAKIENIRKKFYKNPIKLYYRLARWKYNKKWAGKRNKNIFNKYKTKIRPTLTVYNVKEIDIYDIPMGNINSDGTVYPSRMLERMIIPKPFPLYDSSKIYINVKGYSWSVYTIFTKNIKKCKEYIDIRPYNGIINKNIMHLFSSSA